MQITVKEILSSRYTNNVRPPSWDFRKDGVDVIRSTDGQTIKLQSDGGQSPPKPGWNIILTKGDHSSGYYWTLYGLQR